jgi:superfamily I DNA/RNA helicase
MKGMDAEAVFVLGLDGLETAHMPEESARALAYVACTRARAHLDIVYCAETPLIASLRQAIH